MKRLLITFVLISFIAIGGFGYHYPVFSDHHHEPGCPFMPGEQAICQMDVLDHISAWQKSFTALLPSFLVVLILSAFYVLWKAFNPPDLPLRHHHSKRGNSH
jgi:hypothetical protein